MNIFKSILILTILLSNTLFAGHYKSYSVSLDAHFYIKKGGDKSSLQSFSTKYGLYLSKENILRDKPYCFYSKITTQLTEYLNKPTFQLCINKKNTILFYEISQKDFRYSKLNSYEIEVEEIKVNILNLNNQKTCKQKAKNYKELNDAINRCL